MTQGVSIATKKDGTVYYRAGLYYKNKHISLGSYADEVTAGNAYLEALAVLGSSDQTPEDYVDQEATLSFEKIIVLLNFRNNGIRKRLSVCQRGQQRLPLFQYRDRQPLPRSAPVFEERAPAVPRRHPHQRQLPDRQLLFRGKSRHCLQQSG